MRVDVLLFGAHPDDVEWGAGGIALLLKKSGVSFAIADLTRGEMGSRGEPEQREREALAAAEYLQAASRENLGLPDCGLVDDPESRSRVAQVIRRLRPKLVLAPFWEDRHPDHSAAGWMVRNAALYCTLRKGDQEYPPHKPKASLYYLLHNFREPGMVVDIASVYQQKLELLRLHESQFGKTADEFGVLPLGVPNYLYGLESRDRFFGSLIGAEHGEALVSDRPLPLASLDRILQALD
jgi:N-acetylglucosamine malate deacetylase 1